MKNIFASTALLAALAAGMSPAFAQQGTPSKDDIINALSSDPSAAGTRGFGFRQMTTVPKAKVGEKTSYHKDGKEAPAASYSSEGTVTEEHPAVGVPILFDFGSAQIKPESHDALTAIGQALQSSQLKTTKILVEGHTDSSGNPPANLALSRQRAEAVKDYLVKEAGISADRLSTVGKGQENPVNPNNPTAPENRRVVLVNLSR